MHSLERRLSEQNELATWIDCNTRDLGHRWSKEQSTFGAVGAGVRASRHWWRCVRCPVSTVRRDGRRPSPHLGGDAR